jgi:hypothetical protein
LDKRLERGTQLLEIVDDAFHYQLRRVVRPDHARDIDYAAVGKQTEQLRAGITLLE